MMKVTTPAISFPDRRELWEQLRQNPDQQWDIVIIGGGIIGAGVLREAVRCGLKALLVEQRDFAWGTSSRSSKMVHGGLRYMAQGDFKLTKHSVQERERLLKEAPGLVDRMGYYFLLRKGQFPGRIVMTALLRLYDWFAGLKTTRFYSQKSISQHFPGIETGNVKGACYYTDTMVDDARLVLRVLQESLQGGGQVINYVQATTLLKASSTSGDVTGLIIKDAHKDGSGEQLELKASAVINATGAWADRLRSQVVTEQRIRPLRGSHLIFAHDKLPVEAALALFHPKDKRPVFITAWEGATLVGTTDLDHQEDLDGEASITQQEVDYLLEIIAIYYPASNITAGDVISSYAGVRPVIGSDASEDKKQTKKAPSKERRDHAVWAEKGLVTVSGGKLSTFRLIALDALNAARPWLKTIAGTESTDAVFNTPKSENAWQRRLAGRYGTNAPHLLENARDGEQDLIGSTQFCLAECRWAIKHEVVQHLDDLLLRRTRLGLLLEKGAEQLLPALETLFAEERGWDKKKWQQEVARYRALWQNHYYLPAGISAKQ